MEEQCKSELYLKGSPGYVQFIPFAEASSADPSPHQDGSSVFLVSLDAVVKVYMQKERTPDTDKQRGTEISRLDQRTYFESSYLARWVETDLGTSACEYLAL